MPSPPSSPTQQPPAITRSLHDVANIARAWAKDLVRRLDGPERLALYQSSSASRSLVLETAQQATVTLRARAGLGEAAWQRRLARAEQDLAERGPGTTTIVLRVPTPHPTALQSALSLPEPASRSVTALKVLQYDYPSTADSNTVQGAPQPWPAADTFPIRTLHLNHMCGPLPSPALLPNLRELQVHLWAGCWLTKHTAQVTRTFQVRCASIAPFLTQLESLSVMGCWHTSHVITWEAVFGSTVSTSLRQFETDIRSPSQTSQIIPLLITHAPQLEQLSCPLAEAGDASSATSGGTWALKRFVCRYVREASKLASLPATPAGLTLLPAGARGLTLEFKVHSAEGLSAAVTERLPQWRFDAPCTARLILPYTISPARLGAGTQAALIQLSALPGGSTVQLSDCMPDEWPAHIAPAIAAAAHHTAHLTVRSPAVFVRDEVVGELGGNNTPLPHAVTNEDEFDGRCAKVPWPWQSLRFWDCARLSEITKLPDPCNGQYEIEYPVELYVDDAHEWADDFLPELERRLQHLTFVVKDTLTIRLSTPLRDYRDESSQPALMRKMLRALSSCRWRFESPSPHIKLQFDRWDFTHELVAELHALPVSPFPVQLRFENCWAVSESVWRRLPGAMPACYSTWHFDPGFCRSLDMKVGDLIAVCRGAQARGRGCEKLALVVQCAHNELTAAERDEVEACVDRLSKWLADVQWDMRAS